MSAPTSLSDPVSDAEQRLADVQAGLNRACRDAARTEKPLLVAVSKTFDADAIRPLIAVGQRHFGENRVQEAQAKWPAMMAETPGITVHLVGQLQSNKAAEAVALFDVIHSVDRPSLVTALGKAQAAAGKHPACYLQVNIGDEEQKGGCALSDLPALLAQAREAGLNVVGLMCVPPAAVEPAPYFALLAEHAKRLGLAGLSMGMSSDYETAALLGSTVVRVGSALFGSR
ncbi:YggS family pyridoxal phosphate-dependent enzyme [Sandarakinorhabdus limnophila]|uniref:YggS family pyridoxal phosphate-dependent enzyme n=1 Tax=Sandarakinorhabdus limnophila TaxID=210512 RepID=UPI002354D1A0|nr:YggS family pyridoxal phosphate-dependent enzyme [Sandarakinorhabdus limnophila]